MIWRYGVRLPLIKLVFKGTLWDSEYDISMYILYKSKVLNSCVNLFISPQSALGCANVNSILKCQRSPTPLELAYLFAFSKFRMCLMYSGFLFQNSVWISFVIHGFQAHVGWRQELEVMLDREVGLQVGLNIRWVFVNEIGGGDHVNLPMPPVKTCTSQHQNLTLSSLWVLCYWPSISTKMTLQRALALATENAKTHLAC